MRFYQIYNQTNLIYYFDMYHIRSLYKEDFLSYYYLARIQYNLKNQ